MGSVSVTSPAVPDTVHEPLTYRRGGIIDVALLNGVCGDPLPHLRLRHQRCSLFFDLGDSARLTPRLAHGVSGVFISHAHMDNISGSLRLLRSRVGDFPSCRL